MGSKRRHKRPDIGPIDIDDRCCIGNTGCEWDGDLKDVVTEPVFVQKVFDATLVNLQALSTLSDVKFKPSLPRGAEVLRVNGIRCRKFFNPANIKDPRNLTIEPETVLSGGDFVRKENGEYVEVIGPDGLRSQKLIFADTSECDEEERGTPVFGTQRVLLRGHVVVEIDLLILDSRDRKVKFTVKANVPIAPSKNPIVLTNFFELCIPSIEDSAFLPRFAEFCNVSCETRLGTNSINRDIKINSDDGDICVDLIISLCIACEKKIVLPVQLCVLSTGYPELSPDISPICSSFPSLFPNQIDEQSIGGDDNCKKKYRLSDELEYKEE